LEESISFIVVMATISR